MLKDDEGALLGKKALGQVEKTVREHARRMMVEQPHRARWQASKGQSRRAAVIGSQLTAPASSLVTETSCSFYFLDRNSDGTSTVQAGAETLYNDDPDVTAELGTYCRVEKIGGVWKLYYLGCNVQEDLVSAIGAL